MDLHISIQSPVPIPFSNSFPIHPISTSHSSHFHSLPLNHHQSGTQPQPVQSFISSLWTWPQASFWAMNLQGKSLWDPSHSGGDPVYLQPQREYNRCGVSGTFHFNDLKPVPLWAPKKRKKVNDLKKALEKTSSSIILNVHLN